MDDDVCGEHEDDSSADCNQSRDFSLESIPTGSEYSLQSELDDDSDSQNVVDWNSDDKESPDRETNSENSESITEDRVEYGSEDGGDGDDTPEQGDDIMISRHQKFLREVLQGRQREPLQLYEKIAAELLGLLQKSDAPLQLYDGIVDWAKSSFGGIAEKIPYRRSALKSFCNRYNLQNFYPKEVPIYLPSADRTVTIVVNDLSACFYALLTNPMLMRKENLLFNTDNPLLC